jgi:hypothetical protein
MRRLGTIHCRDSAICTRNKLDKESERLEIKIRACPRRTGLQHFSNFLSFLTITQESHKNFDILEYGETLIHTLREEYEGKPGVMIHEDGGVDADSDLIVPFSKLTVDAERYEVARRFAAMLQLVCFFYFYFLYYIFLYNFF